MDEAAPEVQIINKQVPGPVQEPAAGELQPAQVQHARAQEL